MYLNRNIGSIMENLYYNSMPILESKLKICIIVEDKSSYEQLNASITNKQTLGGRRKSDKSGQGDGTTPDLEIKSVSRC